MRTIVVAGVGAVVLVGSVATVLVLGTGGDDGEPGAGPGAAVARVDPDAAIVVRGRLRADSLLTPVPVLEDLPTAAVLQLRVTGFEPFRRGVARQCDGHAEVRRCSNVLPVQFDGRGVATFQYLVRADVGGSAGDTDRCGVDDPPCLVTVTSDDRRREAELLTVFGGRLPPPGTAVVEPRRRLRDGERVSVELNGLPPRQLVTVTTCVSGSLPRGSRCGPPAPSSELRLDADGAGRTELAVTRGPVGTEGRTCEESACVIAVLVNRVDVRVDPVRITFGALPGADYDPLRLSAGLGMAALLAGLAAWLVMRTDWSPVGGAAAPEIDDATYADLDAIIAAVPGDDMST